MTYDYVVTLRKSSEKPVDLLSIFLCAFSILAFAGAQIEEGHLSYILLVIGAVIAGGIAYNLFFHPKDKPVRYKNFLFLAGIAWLAMPFFSWACLLFFLLAFLEYQAKRPLEVGFAADEVVINSLMKRRFGWNQFNNIVLKDDLLTLDFRNNRIFQKQTVEDDDPEADEDEFNQYCKQQLAKASPGFPDIGNPEGTAPAQTIHS
jgi:hypothetical protein